MSTTTQTERLTPRRKLALAVLGLGAFVVGTAELVIVGILNLVAKDTGVSISTAGLLVTAYALGISLGGPIVSALTIRIGRRLLLLLALGVYVLGNVLALLAVNFGELVIARVVTGSIHGLFIGVACTVAAGLVPPRMRGQAISMVFGGIAVATVLGVPLGTLVGQALGWQAAFAGVVILGVVALVLTLIVVPPVHELGASGLGAQARYAFQPRVLAMLAVGLLLMGGQFTAFTFLADYLQRVTGITGGLISAFLLVYGIACAVGTLVGGRFADRRPSGTLLVASLALVVILAGIYLLGANPVLVAVGLALWGLFGFGLVPSFQLRVISLAGQGGDLAATLGASAVNAGIAVGAAVGGWAVATYGVHSVFIVALVIVAVAVPAAASSRWLKVPASTAPTVGTSSPVDEEVASL
ncbi:MAG TPA: MFS transporter [Pseudonocardiaceae bacterium]|nr:MFS transporter [Pseudonocardiaceae bacterium]